MDHRKIVESVTINIARLQGIMIPGIAVDMVHGPLFLHLLLPNSLDSPGLIIFCDSSKRPVSPEATPSIRSEKYIRLSMKARTPSNESDSAGPARSPG